MVQILNRRLCFPCRKGIARLRHVDVKAVIVNDVVGARVKRGHAGKEVALAKRRLVRGGAMLGFKTIRKFHHKRLLGGAAEIRRTFLRTLASGTARATRALAADLELGVTLPM